jgi:hypothetical protein
MSESALFRKVVALALVVAMAAITPLIPPSDAASMLGAVNVVGDVELRGVLIADEATVFSGDHLRVLDKGYAKVLLTNGQKLELDAGGGVTFTGEPPRIAFRLDSGNVAFSSEGSAPVQITAGPFEISSEHAVSGNLAVIADGVVGVRVLSGSALLKRPRNRTRQTISAGEERLLNLNTLEVKDSLQQISSNLPPPVPSAPAPQTRPAGLRSGLGTWLGIAVAAAGGGAIAAIAIVAAGGESDVVDMTKARQTVEIALSTSERAESAAEQIANVASQVNTVISNAANLPTVVRDTLRSQAQQIQTRASTAAQQITSLQQQIQQLQGRLQTSSTTEAAELQSQITSVTQALNNQISIVNGLNSQLNNLISQANSSGVDPIPSVNGDPIPPVDEASATIPD